MVEEGEGEGGGGGEGPLLQGGQSVPVGPEHLVEAVGERLEVHAALLRHGAPGDEGGEGGVVSC